MVSVLNVFTMQSLVASGKKSVLPVVARQQDCEQCSDLSAQQSMFCQQNEIIKKMARCIAQLKQDVAEQNTSISILQKSAEKRKRENESLGQKNRLLARSLLAIYNEKLADVAQVPVPSKKKRSTPKTSKKQAIPAPLPVPSLSSSSSSGSLSVCVPWTEQSPQVILPSFQTYQQKLAASIQQQRAASIPVDHDFDSSARLVTPSSISWKDDIVLNF